MRSSLYLAVALVACVAAGAEAAASLAALPTVARLAARRAKLLEELELLESDIQDASRDLPLPETTCEVAGGCGETKGADAGAVRSTEKEEKERIDAIPTKNLTLADIMEDNIFLRARERQAKLDASLAPWYEGYEGQTHGLLHLFYASPVYRTNINLVKGKGTAERINKPLVDKILEMYLNLVQRGQEEGDMLHNHGAASYNEINNKFFSEQDIDGENFLENMPEMAELKKFIRQSLEQYWLNVPGAVSESLLDDFGDDLFYWAAVSHWGVDHQPHVHFESVLSGVYYLRTPPMSGSFELHDPRGFPKYPFEHHHSIKPTEGDLVLFPGWMPHGVLPTYGPEPRIAIAFNLQAPAEAWLETTNAFDIKIIKMEKQSAQSA